MINFLNKYLVKIKDIDDSQFRTIRTQLSLISDYEINQNKIKEKFFEVPQTNYTFAAL